jgi:branched-chain amino acid transport system substrate-binding protein
MASACAISECFETPNLVSTNQGPLASNLGAAQYAQEELGSKNVACIGLNIPNNGIWSCQAVIDYMTSKGGTGSLAMLNPGAPDVNSALLEAVASGADTILMNLPAGLALAVLKAAQEQDLRDSYIWIAPTPLYDLSVPDAVGEYWHGKTNEKAASDAAAALRLIGQIVGGIRIDKVISLWETDLYTKRPQVFEYALAGISLR